MFIFRLTIIKNPSLNERIHKNLKFQISILYNFIFCHFEIVAPFDSEPTILSSGLIFFNFSLKIFGAKHYISMIG